MYQIFLDANTFLGFYNLTPADISELGKLVDLVKLKKVRLLLPTQVINEVARNRSKVIADRLKPLKESRLQVSIPQMVEKPKADALRKAVAEAQRAHTKLLAELSAAAQQGKLPADKLIADLFAYSTKLDEPAALQKAQERKSLGNPPGKGASIGDGVNWETLLAHGAKLEDLHFVSADADFASALDPSAFDEFLANEWAKAKGADCKFYNDIKSFLDKVFPEIRLASDVRKYFLIDALVSSENFASSHAIVADLNHYDAFSAEEASRLLNGALENTQVRWLATDDDVKTLIHKALDPHRAALPKGLVERWDYLLAGRGYAYGPVPDDAALAAPIDQDILFG